MNVNYLLSIVIWPYRADRFSSAFSGVLGRFVSLDGILKLDIKCSPFHLELPAQYHVTVHMHLASLQYSPANKYLLGILKPFSYNDFFSRAQDFAQRSPGPCKQKSDLKTFSLQSFLGKHIGNIKVESDSVEVSFVACHLQPHPAQSIGPVY